MTHAIEQSKEIWGMIGHAWAVEMLQQQILHDSVRHAYLFTGPAGVGRRTLALRFVQALSCAAPLAPAIPCHKCQICKQIDEMHFPDLEVIQSEKIGGELKIEQVRSIQYNLSLTPMIGTHRFALFLRFHEANPHTANALLKTLEDSPGNSILILTADTLEGLPPTIVSRCEVLRLKPVVIDELESALKTRGVKADEAHLISHLSSGRPGCAFSLLAEPDSLHLRTEWLEDLHRMLSATRVEKIAYAEKHTKDKNREKEKEKVRVFTNKILPIWHSLWRDVLVSASGSNAPLVNIDRLDEIRAMAINLGLTSARKMVARMEKATEQLDRNVNARLLLEVLLLDLPKAHET